MLVSALEKPVHQALQLTGVEFGLLWTLFTFGYILSAPFVGFFTDRYRRTLILAICILILSGATILCGFAQTKMVLYLSRFLIGLGEAGCLIIGPTLISDFFLQEYRGRVLSIFYPGLPLGGTAATILGGIFEKYRSWRVIALVAGVFGKPPLGCTGRSSFPKNEWGIRFHSRNLLGIPFLIGSFFVSANWLFFMMLGVGCFFYFMCMPAVNTQIANVTHPNQGAMAFALAIFVLPLLGDMLMDIPEGKNGRVTRKKRSIRLKLSSALPGMEEDSPLSFSLFSCSSPRLSAFSQKNMPKKTPEE